LLPKEQNLKAHIKDENKILKNEGGRPDETIMLNIDTFKSLCMMIKTDKGKEIRKYYIKLENIYNKIIKEEIEEQKLLLEEKNKELIRTQKQLEKVSKLNVKRWYDSEPGDTIYAVKKTIKGINYIKPGKTISTRSRESNYTDDMFYIKKCYNCDLAEKVLLHILDKYRVEQDKELFEISEELAIYTIDIVCDFLDKFIIYSEELPKSNIKENLNNSLELVKNLSNEIKQNIDTNLKITEKLINKSVNLNNKIVNINLDDKIKLDKFIKEYCELDKDYYALSYDLLGAYRIWSRGLSHKSRPNFTKYMKLNYKSSTKLFEEYNYSYLLIYSGLRPKSYIVKQEKENVLPKYEEFVLQECKYGYTFRIRSTEFVKEFKKWYLEKYPNYNFTKEERINMEAYLNRHFLRERINMTGHKNVPGIWGIQLKSDNTIKVGMNKGPVKKIIKIDINTKKIIEEYHGNLSKYIKENKIFDKKYIYKRVDDIKNNIEDDNDILEI
jgi:phage anti-repressor protein